MRDGSFYLSEEEFESRMKAHMHNYHSFLAKALLKRKGADVWRFHRNKMKEFGHPLSVPALAWAVIALVLDKVLNPKQTAEAALQTIELARNAPPLDGL